MKNKILTLIIFSIAMGYMESAVVVYLREIFYPDGFTFPLQAITSKIAITEIIREAATLIMLLTIAILTGRTKTERFGFFIFCFAIWDITYYVVLYLLLGWPESLLTWDILFLIPVTWVGPVIGPVINSVSMIILAMLISYFTTRNSKTYINKLEWSLLISGSIVLIISYTEDYVGFLRAEFSLWEIFIPQNTSRLMEFASTYVPVSFAWLIFIVGQGLIFLGMGLFYRRNVVLNK